MKHCPYSRNGKTHTGLKIRDISPECILLWLIAVMNMGLKYLGWGVILRFRSHLDAFEYLDSHVSDQLSPGRIALCGAQIISYCILEEPRSLHFLLERWHCLFNGHFFGWEASCPGSIRKKGLEEIALFLNYIDILIKCSCKKTTHGALYVG